MYADYGLDEVVSAVAEYYHNGIENIVFELQSEGYLVNFVELMNAAVKTLTEQGIPESVFVYFTGALEVKSNIEQYRRLIQQYPYIPKRVVYSKSFQLHYKTPLPRSLNPMAKNKLFLSMNSMPRSHRQALTLKLLNQGLLKDSYYSLKSLDVTQKDELTAKFPQLANTYDQQVNEYKDQFPMTLSKSDHGDLAWGGVAKMQEEQDLPYIEDSYFSLVQETYYDFLHPVYDQHTNAFPCIFVTEKTFRQMYYKHPFIVAAAPGFLTALKEAGYKTFSPYFDESYDTIVDPEQRMDAIVEEISRLSKLTAQQWQAIQQDIIPILEHNYNLLLSMNETNTSTQF